jgi:hypothetical protein
MQKPSAPPYPVEGNMLEQRVAFVVGHEDWGKSLTLRALKAICDHPRRDVIVIDRLEFFVRMMSNDDKPESHLGKPR